MGSCCSSLNDKNSSKISSPDLKLNKFGGVDERVLHLAHGRLIGNGACNTACLYTQQGKKGTNQDAMIVWEVSHRPPPFAFAHVCF